MTRYLDSHDLPQTSCLSVYGYAGAAFLAWVGFLILAWIVDLFL